MTYQIMTFSPLGHPMTMETRSYKSREEAEERMKELEKTYDAKMFITKRK